MCGRKNTRRAPLGSQDRSQMDNMDPLCEIVAVGGAPFAVADLPPTLSGLITLEELREVLRRISNAGTDAVSEITVWNMCCLCCPGSGSLLSRFAQAEEARIAEIERVNAEVLGAKGLAATRRVESVGTQITEFLAIRAMKRV